MEQDKADERDTDMSLRSDELDNVETVDWSSQVPVNHTVGEFHSENAKEHLAVEENLPGVGRTRKKNSKDREDVEAEDHYQVKRSLGGHFSRVSTCINQVKSVSRK